MTGTNRGWNQGTKNFFNIAKFDTNADGWPAYITIDAYRNSMTDLYHPRAQRNWHDPRTF